MFKRMTFSSISVIETTCGGFYPVFPPAHRRIGVEDAFPKRTLLAAAREQSAGSFASFSTNPAALMRANLLEEDYALNRLIVIGDVGDDWVVVMTYSGYEGYMKAKWFTP